MKLSHPLAIKFVSLLASWVIRLWLGSLEFGIMMDDDEVDPQRPRRRLLYSFWHENMLLPTYSHSRQGIAVLVSKHRDGELIAQVVRMLGGKTVRGSTNRGGVTALRNMLRQSRAMHLAITPDGPRGPRRQVGIGVIYLASRSGMPLVPLGFAADGCWRAPSWDRMVLPRPFRRAQAVSGRPIEIPAGLDRAGLEKYRQQVQAAMDDVQKRAEQLAGGMSWRQAKGQ